MILALLAAMAVRSTPDLGVAEARCRPDEPGPAVIVTAEGLKDRKGVIRAELYPADDDGFLADDNVLVSSGRVFRRAVQPVPPQGAVQLCLRVPGAGPYALALVHDRDGGRAFSLSADGIGFANNPVLHMSKPTAEAARFMAGPGVTHLSVRLNYRTGLFSFGPIRKPAP